MIRRFSKAMLLAALLGATALTAPVLAQTAQPAATAPAAKSIEVFTAMRDGTKLASNVFLPDGKGPWPVVLTRTPT